MNNLLKSVLLSGAIVVSTLVLSPDYVSAATSSIKVQINDSLVSFPDEQPFVDSKGFTQVPIRMIAEKMGSTVEHEKLSSSRSKVTIKKGSKTIVLKSGSNIALVGSKQVVMDTSMRVVDGRSFVPVRFVSEAFGYSLKWDSRNKIAIISTDGKNHAPAWTAPVHNSSKGNQVVSIAKQYLGTKYIWGGASPSTGFDCSGYVKYVYGKMGVSLPHSSVSMHNNYGTPVSKSNLKPGDLVFFITNKVSTSHVGIYIGDNKFISATSSGVTIASINSSYWGPKYNGANRIFK
ncbi:NlpC/P60 family protein [Paenibacillus sp. N3/727]|uniref:C40 family peptidase n=1 Tax=Paenibacillus sp. N3/727 TaxID=2925845 RepID=UPI001F534F8C|nr:NlpC/P60 family protein [Paenibacillus sp. N3/727]UNK20625.1 NlpC/P60 family protein [Paenibacillus sp. N3/727]